MDTISLNSGALSSKTNPAYEQARLQLLHISADTSRSCCDLLTDIAKITAQALNVERVGVWVLADEGKVLRCYHLFQRTGAQVFSGTVLRKEDFPTYFMALHSQRAIPADDARTHPLTHELDNAYLQPLRITSMLDAPIYSKGKVVGVVCHEDTGSLHQWNTADYAFAASIADTISRLLAEHKGARAENKAEQYESQLREMHHMEALGRAAANIAHDFRNVLSAIFGYGGLIQSSPAADAQAKEYAQRIVDAAERGRLLTQQLLSFGRDEPATPRILDLRHLIESLRDMLQVLVGKRIRLHIQLTPVVGRVLIDALQLERALVNLVVNARDAMPSGGDLTISLQQAAADQDDDTQSDDAQHQGARQVVISVTDTGVGIDVALRPRIFEPFYTTKGEHGNGLGLTIVHQIVTRAGGSVHVNSQPGKGTTMSLHLPCIAPGEALTPA